MSQSSTQEKVAEKDGKESKIQMVVEKCKHDENISVVMSKQMHNTCNHFLRSVKDCELKKVIELEASPEDSKVSFLIDVEIIEISRKLKRRKMQVK